MRIKPLLAPCAGLALIAACAGGSDPGDSFNDTFNEGIDAGDADELGSETGGGDDPTTTEGEGDSTTTTTDGGTTTTTTSTSTTTDGGTTTTTTTDDTGGVMVEDMIDNFEDGDGALLPSNGRQGYWYVFNDESEGSMQTPAADMVLPESGGASGTSMAMHTSGSGFTEWGAGIGVDFNSQGGLKMVHDASAFTGVVLMARGSGQIRASIQIEATVPIAEGGTCELDCDAHGTSLVLSDQWQQFALPFNQLTQEGWGTPAGWDASTAVGLQFKVPPNTNFDFWVDEIGFY